jgi:tyramine---L-glutamate ligase
LRRILVHEFASDGAAQRARLPASLLREGRAMRQALVCDLVALGDVEVVTSRGFPRRLTGLDGVFVIAPETRGRLERLCARVAAEGVTLFGSAAGVVALASDKARLPSVLARLGIPHPETRCVTSVAAGHRAARTLGYPLVVKPARGAGSEGVRLVRTPAALGEAVRSARRTDRRVLLQGFVPGTPASVSLLCDGRRARVLAVNAQRLSPAGRFAYRGGVTPLAHPLASRAARAARRVCEAFPGLRGYVGVDVILGRGGAFVIELNPRLTTAYLGLRASLPVNVAGLALAACGGRLPTLPRERRRVRFSAGGRVTRA